MRPVRRRTLLAVSAFPVVGLVAGCDSGTTASGYPVPEGPPARVTYLTNFLQLGRDSYAYLASDRGYFTEAGLEVIIEAGTGTTGNLDALLAGRAQFAAVDMTGAIIARDEMDGFVALAAVQQLPLAAVMTYADRDIRYPRDLEGRSVGLPAGAVTELLFGTYAELARVDPTRIRQVSMPGSELVPALAERRVDAIGQFVVGRPLVEQAVDGEAVVLPYSDVLYDLYGVCLFTTTDLVDRNPGLCARFRGALLRGLAAGLADPAAAGQALAGHVPDTDPRLAAAEMALMQPYTQVTHADRDIGHLDPAKTARAIAVMQANGLAGPSLPPQDLVAFDLTS